MLPFRIPNQNVRLRQPADVPLRRWGIAVAVLFVATMACAGSKATAQQAPVVVLSPVSVINTIPGITPAGAYLSSIIAVDNAGNIYSSGAYNDSTGTPLYKTTNGVSSLFCTVPAGTVVSEIALDHSGNLYAGGYVQVYRVSLATGIGTAIGTLAYPATSLAVDASGNYVYSTGFMAVYRGILSTGQQTDVAGVFQISCDSYPGDGGPAVASNLCYPEGVAFDAAGNLYVADAGGHRVLRVDAVTQIMTTVAGGGTGGDGTLAENAQLSKPWGIVFDGAGNLYITDQSANDIRMVSATTGLISTVAGTGVTVTAGDGGLAVNAGLNAPTSIALDGSGNIYFVDSGSDTVREISASPALATFPPTAVGSSVTVPLKLQITQTETVSSATVANMPGGIQDFAVGASPNCTFSATYSLAAGTVCTVPVTFTPKYPGERNGPLTLVTNQGTVTIGLTGTGLGPQAVLTPGIVSSGPGLVADLGIATDSAGNLFYASSDGQRVFKIDAVTGVDTVVAGSGSVGLLFGAFSGDGGPATSARLNIPQDVGLDAAGNVYIADGGNYRIRMVSAATGNISTVAGNGSPTSFLPSQEGGPATAAAIIAGYVAVDAQGDFYVYSGNYRILRVDAVTHLVHSIAGTGVAGDTGDNGPATSAEIEALTGLAVDPQGNVFFAGSTTLRRVAAATGIISTVATDGYIEGVGCDSAGNVFWTDSVSSVYKWNAVSGAITRVAGNGLEGAEPYNTSQNGLPATSAQLPYGLQGVAVDPAGNIHIAVNNSQTSILLQVSTGSSAVSFASTAVGGVSSDSPRQVILSNVGNMPLTLSVPASGTNPSVPANFTLDQGATTTCPIQYTSSAGGTLDGGADCNYSFFFAPTSGGNNAAPAVVSNNSLDAASTQSIVLSGAATDSFASISLGLANAVVNTAQNLTVSILDPVGHPDTLYTGTVTFTSSNSNATLPAAYTFTAADAGVHTFLNSVTFGSIGSQWVTVTDSATLIKDTRTVMVSPAAAPITWSPVAATQVYAGTPLGNNVLNATSTVAGPITYTATPAGGTAFAVSRNTVLPVGNYTLTATITPNLGLYAAASASIPYSVQGQSIFVANGASVLSLFDNGIVQSSAVSGGGTGAAVDATGAVWSINANGAGVSKFNDNGSLSGSYTGSGITGATALAIDGQGTLWIANGSGTVSEVINQTSGVVTTGPQGTPPAPSGPIAAAGNISAPASISVDAAGSLWIASSGNNSVTEVIGVAAPVIAPTVNAVISSSPGSLP